MEWEMLYGQHFIEFFFFQIPLDSGIAKPDRENSHIPFTYFPVMSVAYRTIGYLGILMAGEMAQLAEFLPCEHEFLSVHPHTHIRTVIHGWLGEVETEGFLSLADQSFYPIRERQVQ